MTPFRRSPGIYAIALVLVLAGCGQAPAPSGGTDVVTSLEGTWVDASGTAIYTFPDGTYGTYRQSERTEASGAVACAEYEFALLAGGGLRLRYTTFDDVELSDGVLHLGVASSDAEVELRKVTSSPPFETCTDVEGSSIGYAAYDYLSSFAKLSDAGDRLYVPLDASDTGGYVYELVGAASGDAVGDGRMPDQKLVAVDETVSASADDVIFTVSNSDHAVLVRTDTSDGSSLEATLETADAQPVDVIDAAAYDPRTRLLKVLARDDAGTNLLLTLNPDDLTTASPPRQVLADTYVTDIAVSDDGQLLALGYDEVMLVGDAGDVGATFQLRSDSSGYPVGITWIGSDLFALYDERNLPGIYRFTPALP